MSLQHTFHPHSPTPTDDAVWAKGDFALISGDHVSFRVPSYYLQVWSEVFRGMLELCGGERLVRVTESAATVRHFLHLVTTLRLDLGALEAGGLFTNVLALLGFLEKYHCALALELLLERLDGAVYGGRWPHFLLFLVGARLGRACLCRDVVACGGDRAWAAFARPLRPPGVAPELDTLSVRALPKAMLELLPVEYAYALVCADVGADTPDTRFKDRSTEDRFVAFLELCAGTQVEEPPNRP